MGQRKFAFLLNCASYLIGSIFEWLRWWIWTRCSLWTLWRWCTRCTWTWCCCWSSRRLCIRSWWWRISARGPTIRSIWITWCRWSSTCWWRISKKIKCNLIYYLIKEEEKCFLRITFWTTIWIHCTIWWWKLTRRLRILSRWLWWTVLIWGTIRITTLLPSIRRTFTFL